MLRCATLTSIVSGTSSRISTYSAIQPLVDGGGRLVEEHEFGLQQQDPGERDTLLLTRREDLRPVLFLVEAALQVLEADLLQRLAEGLVVDVVGFAG